MTPPLPRTAPEHDDSATLNRTFRHSFWRVRRERTLHAMATLDIAPKRQDRFMACGDSAWVLIDANDPNRYRLAVNRCRDRWCEACQTERRRTITRNVAAKLRDRSLRLLTLTLKSQSVPLTDQIDRLLRSFRRFRQAAPVRHCLVGGLYFVEITYNNRRDQWHPHLHVIFEGGFLPHELAKQTWLHVTGDSYVVDVRALHNSHAAASYVAKYAAKAVSHHVWTCPARFKEAIVALHGRRTFHAFGHWRALDLSKLPPDDTEWVVYAPLADLIRRARARDPDALRALRALSATFALEPFDREDVSFEPT